MFNSPKFRTLKLKNGDISFDNLGKLNWLTNEESIAQTVNIRLMTELGDLFYDELFGLERRYIKNTILNIMTLEPEIRNALVDNEKIIDVQLVDIIRLTDSAILKIVVILHNQDEVLVDFNVDGEQL